MTLFVKGLFTADVTAMEKMTFLILLSLSQLYFCSVNSLYYHRLIKRNKFREHFKYNH